MSHSQGQRPHFHPFFGQALARGEDVDALAAAAGVTVPATKKGPAAMCGTETVPMYAACRNLIGSPPEWNHHDYWPPSEILELMWATTHCWRLVGWRRSLNTKSITFFDSSRHSLLNGETYASASTHIVSPYSSNMPRLSWLSFVADIPWLLEICRICSAISELPNPRSKQPIVPKAVVRCGYSKTGNYGWYAGFSMTEVFPLFIFVGKSPCSLGVLQVS